MVIKSLHTYLWRLSLGSSWAGPSRLCGGSACSFDSAPQGNLNCTFFLLQPLTAKAVKRQILDSAVAPPHTPQCLLYMVTGPGRLQGFHFTSSMLSLISHPMFQGEKWSIPAGRPFTWPAWHPRPSPQRECCPGVPAVFSTLSPDRLLTPIVSPPHPPVFTPPQSKQKVTCQQPQLRLGGGNMPKESKTESCHYIWYLKP